MTPLLHMLILVSDTWERLSNLLVPTPPFDHENHQLRLALYIAPLGAAFVILSRDTVMKGIMLAVGVALFGDPVLTHMYHYMNGIGLTEILHLNNTLFNGVPTNVQLALTLLRLGEENMAPLPPPVHVHHAPPDGAIDIDKTAISATGGDMPLGVSQEELEAVAEHNPEMAGHAGGEDTEAKQAGAQGKKREKVFELVKDGVRGAAKAVAGADRLRAKAGIGTAKLRAGVMPTAREKRNERIGPVEFSARYEGLRGFVHVDAGAEEPFVAFERIPMEEAADEEPRSRGRGRDRDWGRSRGRVWAVRIDDITQLRKHSGYGMKTKLATGWATDGPIYDGLRIVDAQGNNWVVTALPYRDALFNRLCAISRTAKWEIW